MKLTENEQKICDEYSKRDAEGFVHCQECPLNISENRWDAICYANIDGRTKEAKELKRL